MESFHENHENFQVTNSDHDKEEELKEVDPLLLHISLSIPGVVGQVIISGASMSKEFVEFLTELEIDEVVVHLKEAMKGEI